MSITPEYIRLAIFVILAVLYIVAWIFAMIITCKAATDKGYPELRAQLVFIGLFGLIFTPPIIVAALPDRHTKALVSLELQKARHEMQPVNPA